MEVSLVNIVRWFDKEVYREMTLIILPDKYLHNTDREKEHRTLNGMNFYYGEEKNPFKKIKLSVSIPPSVMVNFFVA